MSFPYLFRKATSFSQDYIRIVHSIGQAADDMSIPDLFGSFTSKLGLVEHFLIKWPNNSGRALYEDLKIGYKDEFKACTSLCEFVDFFFELLKPNLDVRTKSMALDQALRYRKDPTESSHSKTYFKPKHKVPFKSENRVSMLRKDDSDGDEDILENEVTEEYNSETDDTLEENVLDEDYQMLAATGQPQLRSNTDKKFPGGCFAQFAKGVCENRSRCTYDHSPEAMAGLIKSKLRQIVNTKCKHTMSDTQLKDFLEECFKTRGQRGAGNA
jgi:hypothetical protein